MELLGLLLSQSRDYAIFFMAPDGVVSDWYPAAEYVFGWSAAEMVGGPFSRIFTPEDLAHGADRHELEVAASLGREEDDRWHVRKDGTRIWGSGVTLALRDSAGELTAYAKLVRNRTDVKTQTEALEMEKAVLDRRDKHASTFLAILGHELRNPLAPMTNAIDLIRRTDDAAIKQQALSVLDRQVAVMVRLVEDIMDVTRATSGKMDLKRRVLDLRDVVGLGVESARAQASERSQSLRFTAIEGAIVVEGDRDRLQQVFANLLNNAIKYAPPGGDILVNATIEGEDGVVRFEDNGVGMDAAVLPHIFELFTQEESSREASAGGVGLGLPLVREIVRAHGGTVQARSNGRGKGSVFTVRLPLRDAMRG